MEVAQKFDLFDIVKENLRYHFPEYENDLAHIGRNSLDLIGMDNESFIILIKLNSSLFTILLVSTMDNKEDGVLYTGWYSHFSGPIVNVAVHTELGVIFFVSRHDNSYVGYVDKIRISPVKDSPQNEMKCFAEWSSFTQLNVIKINTPGKLPSERDHSSPKPKRNASNFCCYLLICQLGGSVSYSQLSMSHEEDRLRIKECKNEVVLSQSCHWSQWDVQSQRICTMHSDTVNSYVIFTCFQFIRYDGHITHKQVFYMDLDHEFKKTSQENFQTNFNPNQQVTYTNISASAFSSSQGSFILCIENSQSLVYGTEFHVRYVVYFLHSGKKLAAQRSEHEMPNTGHIQFFQLDNEIGISAGPYLHLAGCSRHTVEIYSIILPNTNLSEEENLMYINLPKGSAYLYSVNNKALYSLKHSVVKRLTHFVDINSLINRLNILRSVVTQYSEPEILKDLFQTILSAPCNPQIQDLIFEFLVSSIHSKFTHKIGNSEWYTLVQSSTTLEDVEDVFKWDDQNDQIISVIILSSTYSLHNLRAQAYVYSKQAWCSSYWQKFSDQIIWHQHYSSIKGFAQSLVFDENAKSFVPSTSKPRSSLSQLFKSMSRSRKTTSSTAISKLKTTLKSPSKSEALFGRLPYFLEDPLFSEDQKALALNAFKWYLSTDLNLSSIVINEFQINHISEQYVDSMVNQLQFLFQAVHYFLGSHIVNVKDIRPFGQPDKRDTNYYHILGNILLVCRENGFPIPPPMDRLFHRLAYRCLCESHFMRLLKSKYFQSLDQDQEFLYEIIIHSETKLSTKFELLKLVPSQNHFSLFNKLPSEIRREIIKAYSYNLYSSFEGNLERWIGSQRIHSSMRAFSNSSINISNPIDSYLDHLTQLENTVNKNQHVKSKIHKFRSAYSDILNPSVAMNND